ncbi:MAG: NYN domain-containing protein, partial [Candidatus Diapherotrites archaeon]
GIDIMLVTDMIQSAYQDKFDTALLASGDADYVPAVHLVQELKKDVVNLHLYAGSSAELRNECDFHKLVKTDASGKVYFV